MIGLGWWGKKMTAVLQTAKDDIEIVCAAEPDSAGKEFAEANRLINGTLRHPWSSFFFKVSSFSCIVA
jgi:predicted dehydrogenase